MHHHHHRDCEESRAERAAYWLARRMRRHGFMSAFAAMPGDDLAGGMFRPGRIMNQEDLRLALLALLEEKPRHGYELIMALTERSAGHYSPSPGIVYPTLTFFDEAGYATVEADGSKKLYTITEEGKAYLAKHRQAADAVLAKLTLLGQTMARMRERYGRRERTDFSEDIAPRIAQTLRRLTATLAGRSDATPEEEERILEILSDAIDQIRRS